MIAKILQQNIYQARHSKLEEGRVQSSWVERAAKKGSLDASPKLPHDTSQTSQDFILNCGLQRDSMVQRVSV